MPKKLLNVTFCVKTLKNILSTFNIQFRFKFIYSESINVPKITKCDLLCRCNGRLISPRCRPQKPLGRVEAKLYLIFDLGCRSGWGVSVTPWRISAMWFCTFSSWVLWSDKACKTTFKLTVLYILVFKIWTANWTEIILDQTVSFCF